ncbi:hypothetical protein PTTG_10232 [Puccinia triticina 1-1 BBBD Race 1]|uniref:Uncharacterized protein n=2 Tax=Puccinia triticina TaxID=208348 RepID=A0A0C4FAI9_PUCT1|nr:uncharacterized protein PtA15_15A209 [Puccinia triticina]OAV91034.1 hypothetical protein PTTG_10232 [Puccinia triticina 1-1 BBBD Race 1]WAQ91817.1 hypothetical protein PtA15_15A209 [Puccinia triticina]
MWLLKQRPPFPASQSQDLSPSSQPTPIPALTPSSPIEPFDQGPVGGPQTTIVQCPSAQHPLSELPQLLKMLCNDGIALPCGRLELEGGPWRIRGIIPSCLLDFLANPQIVKLGVGICNDGLKLLRDHKLGPKPFLNRLLKISRLARALGQPDCASGYSCLISLQ